MESSEYQKENIQIVVKQSNSSATAGFILALIAFIFSWAPFIGWVLWLLGLIFSIVGLSKASSVGGVGRGFAIAGIVISLIGVIFLILLGGFILTMIGLS